MWKYRQVSIIQQKIYGRGGGVIKVNTYTMNVLPAGFTPPMGVRRTITDECLGMWTSSSVYSNEEDKKHKGHVATGESGGGHVGGDRTCKACQTPVA